MKTARTNTRKPAQRSRKPEIQKEIIPIVRKGRPLGELRLELDVPADTTLEERIYAFNAFISVIKKCRYLEADTDFEAHFDQMKKWGSYLAISFIHYQPRRPGDGPTSSLVSRIIEKANEDMYFDLIGSFGLTALRNPEMGGIVDSLLRDKKKAGNSINKIAKALVEYAGISHLPLKVGKPEVGVVPAVGRERIRSLYEDLTGTLGLLKKDRPKLRGTDALELLVKYWNDYYCLLQGRYNEDQIANAGCYRIIFEMGPPYGLPAQMIYGVLREDFELQDSFLSLKWVPNEMAKKIIGKLLGVSGSKILSVLFR